MRRVAYFNPPYIKLKHVLTSRVAFVTAGISLNAVICFSSSAPDEDKAAHNGRCDVVGVVAADVRLRHQTGGHELHFGERSAKELVHRPASRPRAGRAAAEPAAQGQPLRGKQTPTAPSASR
eukprot:545383-Prorocentrum_minimum.AAC.6